MLDWPQTESELAHLRHNYAVLLGKHDYFEEAGRQWHQAVNLLRGDSTFRQTYGNYLLAIGKPDIAVRLIRGEELGASEDDLISARRPLPAGSFLDDIEPDQVDPEPED
jgi:hypothetical protein